jgi:hypothetical protein
MGCRWRSVSVILMATLACDPGGSGLTQPAPCQPAATISSPAPLRCGGWRRDEAYAAFAQGKVEGGRLFIAPLGRGEVYVTRSGTDSTLAHVGVDSPWAFERLPSQPSLLGQVWPTANGDVWAAASERDRETGAMGPTRILRRSGGEWRWEPPVGKATGLGPTWGQPPTAFVVARNVDGVMRSRVWARGSGDWVATPLTDTYLEAIGLWGDGTGAALAYGGSDIGGARLHRFDGHAWRVVTTAPGSIGFLYALGGTSLDDLYVLAAIRDPRTTALFHVTSCLDRWTLVLEHPSAGLSHVWSPRPGVALAVGSTRMMTVAGDAPSPLEAVPGLTRSITAIGVEPDGATVHLLNSVEHVVGECR